MSLYHEIQKYTPVNQQEEQDQKLFLKYMENCSDYLDRENQIAQMCIRDSSNNIYGYIDIGFTLVASDIQVAIDTFNGVDLKAIAEGLATEMPSFNLSYVGNSIVYTPGGVSTQNGHLPAHTNNFLEIMADGSSRMRILLINNDPEDSSVNMTLPMAVSYTHLDVYKRQR